jgi:hypothetical protein
MNNTERLNTIRDASLDAAGMITDAYSPQWRARIDVAKTLVPLASGALIFTIGFSSSFAKSNVHPAWRYCLAAGWGCFLVAHTCALLSLWFSIGLHDMKANILEQSDKLRAALAKPDANADSALAAMGDIFIVANTPIERKDKMSRRLLNLAYVSYGVAILLVTVLGAHQLAIF